MCLLFQVVLGQLFFQGGCGVEVNRGVSVCVWCFRWYLDSCSSRVDVVLM